MPDITVADLMRDALAQAFALALPTDCAGCGEPDVTLCEDCREKLSPVPTARDLDGMDVWSGLEFGGVAARVLRRLKEDGRTGLARALGPALAEAAREAPPFDVAVAVPCSRASFRTRGYRVVDLLGRRAGLPMARLLRPTRVVTDQRSLDRESRRHNVAGSMRGQDAAGRRILVVDDVVTTGATLQEAARALRAAGGTVVGAVTVAATPLREARRWSAVNGRTHR